MRVERSIDISAPPERVWPYMSEPEKVITWYTPLQKFEYTSEQQGGVGAPLYFEEKVGGMTLKLDCRVTEWIEHQVFAFEMVAGKMMTSYRERWTLQAIPAGSRFTFLEQGEFPFGFLGRLLSPLAERTSGATVAKMLAALKRLVEAS